MASSEDFQRVYELNKKQGVPNGFSIVKFCQHNGILYSQFERLLNSKRKHYGEAMTKAGKAKDYVRNTYDVSVTAQSYLQEYEKIVCRWANSKKRQCRLGFPE